MNKRASVLVACNKHDLWIQLNLFFCFFLVTSRGTGTVPDFVLRRSLAVLMESYVVLRIQIPCMISPAKFCFYLFIYF